MADRSLVKLEIKGMTCQGCVNSVTHIVKRSDPDAKVAIDLTTGRLEATTLASPDSLVAAINKAGYEARPA